MAEAVVLVCDECGRPDATTITIRTGTANYAKDLCAQHLAALLANTRAPRRGRPKGRSTSRRTTSTSGSRSASGRTRRKARTGRKPKVKKAAVSK
jgi:hypothetical protein